MYDPDLKCTGSPIFIHSLMHLPQSKATTSSHPNKSLVDLSLQAYCSLLVHGLAFTPVFQVHLILKAFYCL